ncbi:MAG: 2-dehydropantoate 2-reductase N-terminal domain-containing protein [Myxococcota bacterium]
MRALVIGAGAIGTVYARHLERGGADVCFLVRPGRGGDVRRGLPVTPINEGRGVVELRCPAVTSVPEGVDLVVLALPSDALAGDWLGDLLRRTAGATILLLSPGLDDRALVTAHVDEALVVQGRITAVAWRAPLPGEDLEPSLAYWVPPGAAPLWGPRAGEVAAVLDAGGLASRVVPSPPEPTGSAVLLPLVASLEASGWSILRLVSSGSLPVTARAIREALGVSGRPVWAALVRPWTLRAVLALVPWLTPFPLEAYVARHFSKLGAQTRLQLDAFIARGTRAGEETGALRALRGALVRGRADAPHLAGWGPAGAT